jgi:hypothetical protein
MEPTAQHAAPDLAETLNEACHCRTLDEAALRERLERDAGLGDAARQVLDARPHLFSATTVFVSQAVARTIADTVAAVERVSALPGYRARALAQAPAIARHDFGPSGVFMGFDFHVGGNQPRLIEINTNAGGALLNLALMRAQRGCCAGQPAPGPGLPGPDALEREFLGVFLEEWRSQRGAAPLRSVAIVDDDPAAQYLAPEFELYRRLFEREGIAARVVDGRELAWRDGCLRAPGPEGAAVDLVYNRLTDFDLSDPAHEALRAAYEAGAAVLTPNPRAHALQADKRKLELLGDAALLAAWGAAEGDLRILSATVPRTRQVTPEAADELWAQRRRLFFKPVAGYGAKAAWRGDKLTKRVWGEILAGSFVAQELVPPPQRAVDLDGAPSGLKFDLRAYAYRGRVQMLAARIYSGQTTNFRTPGGGFAPVVVVP